MNIKWRKVDQNLSYFFSRIDCLKKKRFPFFSSLQCLFALNATIVIRRKRNRFAIDSSAADVSQPTTSRRASAKNASTEPDIALWVGVLESRTSERRLSERVVLHSVCPRASVKQSSPALCLPPFFPHSYPRWISGLEGLAEDTCRRLVVQLLPANPRDRAS